MKGQGSVCRHPAMPRERREPARSYGLWISRCKPSHDNTTLQYSPWPKTNVRGLTTLVEQVSHHPPITAYHIANASRGITLEGHNAQNTSFSGNLFALSKVLYPRPKYITGGNIIVKQVGHATL